MQKINEIIKQIASTSGRNDKELLISLHKDNQLMKNIFKFIYCPYTLTGLSSKKINKKVKDIPNVQLTDINEAMEYLKTNSTGKDIDIANIQSFIQSQPVELHDLYKQIFTKELKIGATDGTLNKVYGEGFIRSFDVMLAKKYFDNEHKVKGEFILTDKLDGIRNVLIKENGIVKMFSRQGQPHEGFIEIEEEAMWLPDNFVFDGEFILINDKGLNSADLYRETVKVARKDGTKQNIIFHVFDGMPLEDFINGTSNTKCSDRKNCINELLEVHQFSFIKAVPMLYQGKDKEVILPILDKAISEGKEGIMLNISDAPYECKRSGNILKIKRMDTLDLKVISFEEGTGKYVGKMGRMNVEYKGFIVGVGSGFSDEDRINIWNNQQDYIGKIAEVQYFEESSNQNGGISLRFPVFKHWRLDKTEPSYN